MKLKMPDMMYKHAVAAHLGPLLLADQAGTEATSPRCPPTTGRSDTSSPMTALPFDLRTWRTAEWKDQFQQREGAALNSGLSLTSRCAETSASSSSGVFDDRYGTPGNLAVPFSRR
jgi:hypothetical protein